MYEDLNNEASYQNVSDSIAEKFWVHKHSCVLLNHSSDLGGCWKVSFFPYCTNVD